ncbi:winged helix-turn-helix transcriptional regulator [Herbidospora galbida]|uniref:winged helix-turn-helix transcriptional regulator n=1 Tax=Herbidospora galbida TaxID=2575442 RepID=UPI001BAE81E9|nr:winged helix-turn-helix transcriptional regulator [Herbidospora galbida]
MSGRRSYGDSCGLARGFDVIGERWAVLVVRDLLLGPKRFGDLLSGLPGVSPNVLSQRLRDLADHGVVRRVDLGPPTRVHLYELTEWGRELEPILLQLGRWGSQAPSPPDRPLGIDSLLLSVKTLFDVTRAAELRGRYELRIDEDVYVTEVTENALLIDRRTPPGPPDAVLTTDLATLRNVCERRITVDDAARSGLLHLAGDEPARRRLTDLLLSRG